MKSFFNKIIIIIFILIAVSCSNDFLRENLDASILPAGDSTIFISPEWEAGDYQFYLPNMGNADFEIEAAPSWLQIDATTGKLINSMATIHCSATKNSDFEKVGIYLDKIKISTGEQTFYVPVAYITEGNPKIQVEKTLTITDNFYLQINNFSEGILIWDIVSLPDWLNIDMDRFNDINPAGIIVPQNSSVLLPLKLNLDANIDKNLTGNIVLKTNDKSNPMVEVNVVVDLGNPEINIWLYDNKIDFGATETTYSLDISAWGSGLLVWHFEDLPDWLTITPSKGIYSTYTSYGSILFTCDRTKLQPGVNSSVIYLKSNAYNSPSIAITIIARAPGDNANIRALEGNIIDVAFDKNTNTLYYVTNQPNTLVAFDITKRTVLHELQLSKEPTCLAVSEDCTKAAIGYDREISAVDLGNWSVKNISVNDILSDIAWSESDWFCYTTTKYTNQTLCWINTNNSATFKSTDNNLYGNDIIKKVPTQPYIVATRQQISPTGFITYSVSTKDLKSYSHMDLSDFWFSQDGQYTFSTDGNVYRTSSATDLNDNFGNYINSIGQLQSAPDDYYFTSKWIDHSLSSHNIWVIPRLDNSKIYQLDDNNFTFQKSYFYSDVYQPNTQTVAYEVEAQYVFANKGGTELSVLCKGKNNNNWSVEFIQVTP